MRLAQVADVQHDAVGGGHDAESRVGEQREHRHDVAAGNVLSHHQEHDDQHAEDQRRLDAKARDARGPRAALLGRAEIALEMAKPLFEERLPAGDLDVLDRAETLLQQVQLLLIQRALGFADPFPRPARQHDRHQHQREHHADGHQRDRRRRDDQHRGKRENDHRFSEDVDRRARAELVGDVRRARHRLDQRRRSAPGVEQVIGGQVAREQSLRGNGGRPINDALPVHSAQPRNTARST